MTASSLLYLTWSSIIIKSIAFAPPKLNVDGRHSMPMKAGAGNTVSVTSVEREGRDVHRSRTIHEFPAESSSLENLQTLHASLVRLNFTPAQIGTILDRVRTCTLKQQNLSQGVDSIISGLAKEFGFFTENEVRTMVLGYPLIVIMPMRTELIPKIAFLRQALDDDEGFSERLKREKVVSLLCEMPSVLEYNVKKRLSPRLEKVRSILNDPCISSDILMIIATKTDSRFNEWLCHERKKLEGNFVDSEESYEIEPYDRENKYIENSTKRPDGEPCAYVIVSNLQSGNNIGNIIRSASIFGCDECLVVGQKRYRLTGDHGARFDLPRRHFYSHLDAKNYLRQKQSSRNDKQVRVYGVEIMANARPIMRYDPETGVVRFPFDLKWKGAAFIFGNEGQGLSEKQREVCDEFLFIPQTRGGSRMGKGSASMNVACAAAVVLQAYCTWAGFSDALIQGEKFLSDSPPDVNETY